MVLNSVQHGSLFDQFLAATLSEQKEQNKDPLSAACYHENVTTLTGWYRDFLAFKYRGARHDVAVFPLHVFAAYFDVVRRLQNRGMFESDVIYGRGYCWTPTMGLAMINTRLEYTMFLDMCIQLKHNASSYSGKLVNNSNPGRRAMGLTPHIVFDSPHDTGQVTANVFTAAKFYNATHYLDEHNHIKQAGFERPFPFNCNGERFFFTDGTMLSYPCCIEQPHQKPLLLVACVTCLTVLTVLFGIARKFALRMNFYQRQVSSPFRINSTQI